MGGLQASRSLTRYEMLLCQNAQQTRCSPLVASVCADSTGEGGIDRGGLSCYDVPTERWSMMDEDQDVNLFEVIANACAEPKKEGFMAECPLFRYC